MNARTAFFRPLIFGTAVILSTGFQAAPARATAAAPAASPSAVADAGPVANGARNFVSTMASKAVAFLGDKSLSEAQKKSQFRTLLFQDFDMDTIGRFSLGSYWNAASPAQRQQYLSLFREMIATVYAQRFEGYNGQKFDIRGVHPSDEKDTLVNSVIIPNGSPEVQVDWRVRYKNGHYQVVDVIVEGVSMAVTQRSDFSSVIQQGGGNIQVLLDHLRQPVAADAPMPTGGAAEQ